MNTIERLQQLAEQHGIPKDRQHWTWEGVQLVCRHAHEEGRLLPRSVDRALEEAEE